MKEWISLSSLTFSILVLQQAMHSYFTSLCLRFSSQVLSVCWLQDASYGRGIGLIPRWCPKDYPDYDGGSSTCYKSCGDGFFGVRLFFSRKGRAVGEWEREREREGGGGGLDSSFVEYAGSTIYLSSCLLHTTVWACCTCFFFQTFCEQNHWQKRSSNQLN